MIQRIQSIYLLIVAVVSGALIFAFDLWSVEGVQMYAFDFFSEASLLKKLVPIFFIGSALLAFFSIFSYKDRKKQFVLGRIIILINLFLLGILMYLSLSIPGEVTSEKGIGMFLPTIAILFSVMANRAIKKDEDLVKSVDRLR